jgi:glycosyltransferase involved in cell wall biosynthesis
MSTPAVSVIIPSNGDCPHLTRCLSALDKQEVAEPFEIVVATGEDSPVHRQVRAGFPHVRVTGVPPNMGPGGARNRGMEAARGELFLFIDSDCEASPDWVATLTAACKDRQGGPVNGWVDIDPRESWLSRAVTLAETGMSRPADRVPVQSLWGGNMALSRELATAGGGFPEGMYGAEEPVLVSRLPPACLPVMLEPRAVVLHAQRGGFCAALRRMRRMGYGSGWHRAIHSIRGSVFARYPCLTPLLVPARAWLALARAVRTGRRALWEYCNLFPLLVCLWTCYAIGFLRGARDGRKRTREAGS